jgi:2-C-methyl-D-erythritol 2,4-cyclodiphosphate synthase
MTENKDISSLIILQSVNKLLKDKAFPVSNIDATVIAQKPKLAPYIPEMIKNIAETLGIDTEQVNIKATTEEGLGFTGKKEGIAAHAVVLIYQ